MVVVAIVVVISSNKKKSQKLSNKIRTKSQFLKTEFPITAKDPRPIPHWIQFSMSNGSIDVVVEVVVEVVVRVEHIRFPDESFIQFPTAGCCVVVTPVQSVLIQFL